MPTNPILGVHNPKNIHDTMGKNLISSSWKKAFLTTIKTNRTTYYLFTWRWKKTKWKKIGGKRLKGEKVDELTFALVLHQWFNNNKASFVTIEGTMVSKSSWIAQIYWGHLVQRPNVGFQNSHKLSSTCGYYHVSIPIMIWRPKNYQ
jgi:hypothetical protein